MMTVAELIAKLEKLPQNLVVEVYSYDDYQDDPVAWLSLETVELSPATEALPATVQLSY